MDDQTTRGRVLELSESVPRRRFPHVVIASLGALRKDKPSGVVTARVLSDGTHGTVVNTRTCIQDQGEAPVAADFFKR